MQYRWFAFPFIAIALVLIYFLFSTVPTELAPLEDRSRLSINATAPEGSTFEFMDIYVDEVVDLLQEKVPEKEGIISVTSPGFGASSSVNSAFINLILKQPDQRERSQQQIADDITPIVSSLSDATTFITQQQTIGGGRRGGLPVQFVLQAPNFELLEEFLPKFIEETRKYSQFTIVDVNLKFNKPELKLSIDRQKARALGVSTIDFAETIQAAFSGQRFGYFIKDGKQYQVIGQFSRENRDAPIDLKSTYVKNNKDELIQLDNVVYVQEQSAPPQLYRFNRYVSATISAGLAPGISLGRGIDLMYLIADKVLDERFATSLDGTSKDFKESSSSLLFAFLLALGLIYLVLAAQFESFRDPFIILFTVPLALLGALLSLWYFNQSLNIFSQIGIIMLIGLVTKNGILIVEFANQRKASGLSKDDAVISAAASRLRPILMTSLFTVLGTLPIALALGAGSESRVSMGIAVVGGLILSTFLTLFIIPAIYSFFSKKNVSAINSN